MTKTKKSKKKPAWVRTSNARGVEATFEIKCPLHNLQMFLRNSVLMHTQREAEGRTVISSCIKVLYKCPHCAIVFEFYVESPVVDNKYWSEVLDWRNDFMVYIPPREEWTEESAIKKQLEALGYWGG